MIPNITYIDSFIVDGKNDVLSLKNFYDTILIKPKKDHIIRIPYQDFFTKYKNELEDCIQLYTISESFYYKPKLLSLKLYNTTELWLGLLRVNNMRNISEFHYPIIKIYNPDNILELINIFFKREEII